MNEFLIFALEEAGKQTSYLLPPIQVNDKAIKVWREILRVVLGLAFLWTIIASCIMLYDFPNERGLATKVWLLLFLAIGLILLFFTILNIPGIFHILSYVNILLFVLSIINCVSFFTVRGASDRFVFSYHYGVFATPLSTLLVCWLIARFDPMPIDSPLLRIAYPKRYAHLTPLYQLAVSKGWKIVGLAGTYHSLHIYGNWNGIPFKLISIHTFTKTQDMPTFDFVVIEMKFDKIFCTFLVGEKHIQTPKSVHGFIDLVDFPKHIIIVPSEKSSPEQNMYGLNIIKNTILSKQKFLNTKVTSITAKNNSLYYRTDNLKIFEDSEKIQLLLGFLINLGNQLKNNDFVLD